MFLTKAYNGTYKSYDGHKFVPNPREIIEIYIEFLTETNLNFLLEYTNLQKLAINNSAIRTLEGLENCTELECLYCNDGILASLQEIENCKNLRVLCIRCHSLKSIEQVSHLKELEIMDFRCNDITSLKGVENCVNLEIVNLTCNFQNYARSPKDYIKLSFDECKKIKKLLV